MSHAGHISGLHTGDKLFSVGEQVDHKAEFILKHLAEDENRQVVLVGHSVGSYICLQLLRRLEPRRVLSVWALYPTVMVCCYA